MQLKILFTAIVVMIALVSSQAQVAQPPYLYYFDDEVKHLVIQRADGTDLRILGDGLMTEPTAIGPGFSPSGRWFAWVGYSIYGDEPWSVYFISADGSESVRYEMDFERVTIKWHPSEDWLLLRGRTITNDIIIRILDVRSGNTLASVTSIPFDNHRCQFANTLWINDGSHALIDCTEYRADEINIIIAVLTPESEVMWITENSEPIGSLNSHGWIATYDSGIVSLINLITDGRVILEIEFNSMPQVFWRDAGEALIAYEGDVYWWTNNELTRIITDVMFVSPWSPNGDYALVGNYLFDGDTLLETAPIDAWHEWLGPYHARVFGSNREKYILNVIDGSLTRIVSSSILLSRLREPSGAALSPDASRFAHIYIGPVIEAFDNATVTLVRPHSQSYRTQAGGEVFWDESGEWLLVSEDALIGNAPTIRNTAVMRPDGTDYRELNFCVASSVCVGWLPSNVDLSIMPSSTSPLKPEPLAILSGTITLASETFDGPPENEWIDVMRWTDNGLLMRSVGGHIRLWDVMENTVTQIDDNLDELLPNYQESDPEFWNDRFVIDWGPEREWVVLLGGEVYSTSTENLIATTNAMFPGTAHIGGNWLIVDNNTESNLTLWDTNTWESYVLPFTTLEATVSPDGEFIAIGQSWDVYVYQLVDLLDEYLQN